MTYPLPTTGGDVQDLAAVQQPPRAIYFKPPVSKNTSPFVITMAGGRIFFSLEALSGLTTLPGSLPAREPRTNGMGLAAPIEGGEIKPSEAGEETRRYSSGG